MAETIIFNDPITSFVMRFGVDAVVRVGRNLRGSATDYHFRVGDFAVDYSRHDEEDPGHFAVAVEDVTNRIWQAIADRAAIRQPVVKCATDQMPT
jgi:hypothetical protein